MVRDEVFIVDDPEENEEDIVSLSDTPAGLILAKDGKLAPQVEAKLDKTQDKYFLTLLNTASDLEITLMVDRVSKELLGWQVDGPQGPLSAITFNKRAFGSAHINSRVFKRRKISY